LVNNVAIIFAIYFQTTKAVGGGWGQNKICPNMHNVKGLAAPKSKVV